MAQSHENLDRNHEVTGSSDRSFGFSFTVVLSLAGVWPIFHGETPHWWSFALAVAILAVALKRPALLARPNRWWTRFGIQLGRVVSLLVLTILYCFMIVPIGFLMRITGKQSLHVRLEPRATTYWVKREPPGLESGSLRRQF